MCMVKKKRSSTNIEKPKEFVVLSLQMEEIARRCLNTQGSLNTFLMGNITRHKVPVVIVLQHGAL